MSVNKSKYMARFGLLLTRILRIQVVQLLCHGIKSESMSVKRIDTYNKCQYKKPYCQENTIN